MEAAAPAIGTTFSPCPRELIEWYLRREIAAGDEMHGDYSGGFFIRGVDVYSAAPYDLVAGHAPAPGTTTGDGGSHGGVWYFFNVFKPTSASSRRTRRPRTVAGGKGTWHTEAGRKQVEGSSGGYMSKFSYKEMITTSSSGTMKQPERWLMTEYSIDDCDTVIAKIYKSPRRHPATNVPPPSYTPVEVDSTMSLAEVESLLMTDAGADAVLDPYDNTSHAIMATPTTMPPPPPLLAQGTAGQYPAGAGQHAADAPGQGACNPMVMDMDDLVNGPDWVDWPWNQEEVLGLWDFDFP